MKHQYIIALSLAFICIESGLSEEPKDSKNAYKPSVVQVQASRAINAIQERQKKNQQRTDAIYKRSEDVLTLEEKNVVHYEKMLKTWEKQQAEFQRYLDSLQKNKKERSH